MKKHLLALTVMLVLAAGLFTACEGGAALATPSPSPTPVANPFAAPPATDSSLPAASGAPADSNAPADTAPASQ